MRKKEKKKGRKWEDDHSHSALVGFSRQMMVVNKGLHESLPREANSS